MDLYDVDDENRQHIERHSQQIEEGEANERRVHLISFRRTVVGSYDGTTKFQPFTGLSTNVAYSRVRNRPSPLNKRTLWNIYKNDIP